MLCQWIFQYLNNIAFLNKPYLVLHSVQFSSVTQLCPTPCNPMDCSTPGFLVHHQLLKLTQTPSCPQPFPASGSVPMSQFFASDGQSIGVSGSALVLPMNIPIKGLISFRINWFDLLAVQGTLKSLFQYLTVQRNQFFGNQLSLWSNSHIHTWLLEKTYFWLDGPLLAK